jgi:hypothetical protein
MLRTAFLRTVESTVNNQNSSPLFVYEALKKVLETKDVISSHTGISSEDLAGAGIVFVPTETSTSGLDYPWMKKALLMGNVVHKDNATECARLKSVMDSFEVDTDRPSRDYINALREYYTKISELEDQFTKDLYKNLGLTSAVVSGGYMFTFERPPKLGGCAGSLVSKLRDYGIQTDISKNVWPPRNKVINAGIPTKETGNRFG